MTIIGAWVNADRALLWADTEWYWRDGSTGELVQAGGYAMKLATSDHLAVAGYGDGKMNAAVGRLIASYVRAFDDFRIDLPPYLMQHAAEFGMIGPKAKRFEESIIIAAGYSHRLRRVLAASFNLETRFAPALIGASGFTMPRVDGEWAFNLASRLDILNVARRQVGCLNLGKLQHGGGALTVAEITREGVSLSGFDLNGCDLDRLPALPSMADKFGLGEAGA